MCVGMWESAEACMTCVIDTCEPCSMNYYVATNVMWQPPYTVPDNTSLCVSGELPGPPGTGGGRLHAESA